MFPHVHDPGHGGPILPAQQLLELAWRPEVAGAFVVFSKALNQAMTVLAVEGSFASLTRDGILISTGESEREAVTVGEFQQLVAQLPESFSGPAGPDAYDDGDSSAIRPPH